MKELKPQIGQPLLTYTGEPYNKTGQKLVIDSISNDTCRIDFSDVLYVNCRILKADGKPGKRTRAFWVTPDYGRVWPVDSWKAYTTI